MLRIDNNCFWEWKQVNVKAKPGHTAKERKQESEKREKHWESKSQNESVREQC